MNFTHIVILMPLLLYSISGTAQTAADSSSSTGSKTQQKRPVSERIQFNMGGGLMLGNQFTNVHLLPQIGYRFTESVTAGIGGHFQYFKNTQLSSEAFLIYGGNIFARNMLSENLFIQAEYQMLNFREEWGTYALIGGGYIPNGRGMYISAYMVLYPQYSELYRVPFIIRGGFIF